MNPYMYIIILLLIFISYLLFIIFKFKILIKEIAATFRRMNDELTLVQKEYDNNK